jgi:RES domain-containing protein
MIVFRLCSAAFPDFLSGNGASIAGGRWNTKGMKMVYTSSSRSLCTAELAVHLPLGIIPVNFMIVSIEIPARIKILALPEDKLPQNWRKFPYPSSTQILGNDFIKQNKSAVCKVPSAVVPGDFNFLLNPSHKDFHLIKVKQTVKFEFDERLFKR